MKLSINQDISFYQLVFNASTSLEFLSLSPSTLLALMRAQIDLLIAQQISATLWVKLPSGKIWHQELARYKSADIDSSLIYNCQIGEQATTNPTCNLSCSCINVQLLPNHQLSREYFLLILSPQFCSLILAVRHQIISQNHRALLSAINTFDGRIIQSLVEAIKQLTPVDSSPIIPDNFVCPITPNAQILNLLLTTQLYRQEEINRQIIAKKKDKIKTK